jgi:hypothetical protein
MTHQPYGRYMITVKTRFAAERCPTMIFEGQLSAAKRFASTEFGEAFHHCETVIYDDASGHLVTSHKAGARQWQTP